MKRTSSILAISCLSVAAVAACSSAAPDEAGNDEAAATEEQLSRVLDVNDVSVLFPLGSDGAPTPAIAVDETLLKAKHFSTLVKTMTGTTLPKEQQGLTNDQGTVAESGSLDKKNWKVVGFRFDPCAPGIGLPPAAINAFSRGQGCLVQLRLIAQPFVAGKGKAFQDVDTTAHLIYQIGSAPLKGADAASKDAALASATLSDGKTTLSSVIDRLVAIKLSSANSKKAKFVTSGEPLGPHKGLNDPATAQLVSSFVSDLVKLSTSRGIAFMGLRGGSFEPWIFAAGAIKAEDDDWHVLDSGKVPAPFTPVETLGFVAVQAPSVANVFPLPNKGTLTTAPLFGSPLRDVDTAGKPAVDKDGKPILTAPTSPAAGDPTLAFKVEHTNTNFFTTDCVSCHSSSARVFALKLGNGAEFNSRVRPPQNVTAYVTAANAQTSKWNTRNFGYFTSAIAGVTSQPTVSQRTANETAEIVEWVNLNIIKALADTKKPADGFLHGPGKDCTKTKLRQPKADGDKDVFLCLRDSKPDCFDNCAPAPVAEASQTVPTPPAVKSNDPAPCTLPNTKRDASGACVP